MTTTRLVKVELAFLFRLGDNPDGSELTPEMHRKAFDTYDAAHALAKFRFPELSTARNDNGLPAYRLEAQSGFTERDGKRYFSLWFSAAGDFEKKALTQLTTLTSRSIADAAHESGIDSEFMGVRQMRTLETIETEDII